MEIAIGFQGRGVLNSQLGPKQHHRWDGSFKDGREGRQIRLILINNNKNNNNYYYYYYCHYQNILSK